MFYFSKLKTNTVLTYLHDKAVRRRYIRIIIWLAVAFTISTIVSANQDSHLNKQTSNISGKTISQTELHRNKIETKSTKAVEVAQASPTPALVENTSKTNEQMMLEAGISPSDFTYAGFIFLKESGFRHTAVNKSSGATGICQALPASKMASAGADYLTNPITQMRWCNSYAIGRYGSWAKAYNFWTSNHWW